MTRQAFTIFGAFQDQFMRPCDFQRLQSPKFNLCTSKSDASLMGENLIVPIAE